MLSCKHLGILYVRIPEINNIVGVPCDEALTKFLDQPKNDIVFFQNVLVYKIEFAFESVVVVIS